MKLITLFLFFLFLHNCHPSLQVMGTIKPITIETKSATCQEREEVKVWYALFGSIAMNPVNFIYRGADKSYRITQETTVGDVIISVLLGLTTSITRNTLLIESCSLTNEVQKKIFNSILSISFRDGRTIQPRSIREERGKIIIREEGIFQDTIYNKEDIVSIQVNSSALQN